MVGSPLLGTAVGLVLLFATTALLCSGITETLSSLLELRAKYLLTGMRTLLDAPETETDRRPRKDGNVWTALRTAVEKALGVARDERARQERDDEADRAAPSDAATPDEVAPAAERSRMVDAAKGSFHQERRNTLHERVKNPWLTEQAAYELRTRLAERTGTPAPPAAASPVPRIPRAEEVTTALWNSPLLRGLQSRRVGFFRKGTLRNPQYVSGRTFARALVDLLVPTDPALPAPVAVDLDRLRGAVQALPEPLRGQLRTLLARAGENVALFEREVEQWYDEQMAKISGWYKRWARVALGIVGFVVAVAVNVDTVQVAHSLYVDAPAQQAVVATANAGTLCQDVTAQQRQDCARDALRTLHADGLTFGYADACPLPGLGPQLASCWAWAEGTPRHWYDLPLKLLGWVITAFAVSFGAPFWFEALSKLGSLRSTGTRPPSTA